MAGAYYHLQCGSMLGAALLERGGASPCVGFDLTFDGKTVAMKTCDRVPPRCLNMSWLVGFELTYFQFQINLG